MRLLRVAQELFARHGYEGTSNRTIAKASGITSGAIYHYFASKAELYAAVYEVVFDKVFSEFEKAVADHNSLVAQYAAVLDAAAMLNREDPLVPAFVIGVAGDSERNPELKQLLRPLRRRNNEFFRRLVARAAERGELQSRGRPAGRRGSAQRGGVRPRPALGDHRGRAPARRRGGRPATLLRRDPADELSPAGVSRLSWRALSSPRRPGRSPASVPPGVVPPGVVPPTAVPPPTSYELSPVISTVNWYVVPSSPTAVQLNVAPTSLDSGSSHVASSSATPSWLSTSPSSSSMKPSASSLKSPSSGEHAAMPRTASPAQAGMT